MNTELQIFKELISKGKTNEAILGIKDHIINSITYQSLLNDILLIQSQYKDYKSNKIKGYEVENSLIKLNEQLLHLVDEINETDNVILIRENDKKKDAIKSLIFKKSDNELYNESFYMHFNSVIENARKEILITGDGFECADEAGLKIAEDFIKVTELALQRNVTVIRIQTKLNISKIWKEKLTYLLTKYPNRFQLFLIDDDKSVDISSICIIDTNEPKKNNIVEFMLSFNEVVNNKSINIAGLAFFIHGDHILEPV